METVEPKVELINHTQDALNLLVFTKSGRLVPGSTYQDVCGMTMDDKREHLEYMFDTIKGAFEFVDYVFHIKNVSRAFTHQLVRTRNASYQQQSMRTVEARGFNFIRPIDDVDYDSLMTMSIESYEALLDKGIHAQDARNVLPTGIHTEITMKVDLRNLSQMAEIRLCKRTQGEYQSVFKQMIGKVLEAHPWAETLLKVYCAKYGICAFPRYKECPVQQYCFDPSTITRRIYDEWEKTTHVAKPVVKDGKTM